MALSLGRKIDTYHSRKSDAEQVVSQLKPWGVRACPAADVGNIASFNAFRPLFRIHFGKTGTPIKSIISFIQRGIGATLPIPTVTEEAFDQR